MVGVRLLGWKYCYHFEMMPIQGVAVRRTGEEAGQRYRIVDIARSRMRIALAVTASECGPVNGAVEWGDAVSLYGRLYP